MTIQKTGVELVAENASMYIALMKQAEDATNSYISALGKLPKDSQALGNAASGAKAMAASNNEAASSASNLFGIMTGATFVGNIVTQAFNKVTSAIMSFPRTALESVKQIQELEISLESLVAKEYVSAGAAETVTDAMEMVGPAADELLLKIKALSVVSPFEYQDIVSVFRLNMAFGLTSETALKLTEAITNVASVNKGIPGVLQRVSYNFSQMAMIGRVTTRDVKDLAMAGVDLNKVFKEQLGKSVKQVDADLQSGLLTFDEVTKAFTDFVDINYGGAAAKASRTLSGLMSTFNDIIFFTASDVFKPVIDRLTVAAGELLDVFSGFVNSGALQWIGAALDVAAEAGINFVKSLIPVKQVFEVIDEGGQSVIQNTFDPLKFQMMRMGDTVLKWAEDAFTWGVEIISQFASGMIEGAAAALSAVMDYISAMLGFWLSPGSPPKVAPDIDKWGTLTMAEFLHGFESADYSVLNSIESKLKGVFGAFLETSDAAKYTLGFSKEIASILSTGEASEDFYDRLRESAGDYGTELETLVRDQLDLAFALKKVGDEQQALADAQKAFEQASDNASSMIEEYNNMLEQGASKETLNAKRAQIKAALQQRKEAKKALIDTAEQVGKDSEANDALQQRIALQGDLLDQLIEYAKLQADANKETKEAAKAAEKEKEAKKGGAADPTKPDVVTPLPSYGAAGLAAQKQFEGMRQTIQEKFGQMFAPLTKVYEERVKPALDMLEAKWKTMTETIRLFWDEKVVPIIDWLKKLIPPELLDQILRVTGQVIGFTAVFVILGNIFGWVAGIVTAVLAPVFAALLSPFGLLMIAAIALKLAWDNNFLGMRDMLLGVWAVLQPVFQGVYDWLKDNIPLAIQTVVGFWNDTLMPALNSTWSWINTYLVPIFQNLADLIGTVLYKAGEALAALWQNVLQPALETFWKDVLVPFYNDTLLPLIDSIAEFLNPALEGMSDAWGDIEEALVGVADWIGNFQDAVYSLELPDWLTPGSPTPLQTALEGLSDSLGGTGLIATMSALGVAFATILTSVSSLYTMIAVNLTESIVTISMKLGTVMVGAIQRTVLQVPFLISAASDLSDEIQLSLLPAINSLSYSLGSTAGNSKILSDSWPVMRDSIDGLMLPLDSVITKLNTLSTNITTVYNAAMDSHIVRLISIRDKWAQIANSLEDSVYWLRQYNIEKGKGSGGSSGSGDGGIPDVPAAIRSSSMYSTVDQPSKVYSIGNNTSTTEGDTVQYILNASVPMPIESVEHGFAILQIMGSRS